MKKTYLSLIIATLIIGFAAISTNLILSGTLNIGSNTDEFEKGVVFTRTNTMHGDATIDDQGKSITFKTTVLKDLKEQAILDYDITNKSLEYDAEITIDCNIEESDKEYEEYIQLNNSIPKEMFKLQSGQTKTGRLTITLIKTYVKEDKSITFKCDINANALERESKGTYIPKEVEYEEILLNGADPVLEATPVEAVSLELDESNKQLIPVTIEDDGTVKRADTTKEWYDYETKQWANAVILNDGVEEPAIGEKIEESEIESYFVWIPKYRYRIFDMGKYTNGSGTINTIKQNMAIEIEFGTENTQDSATECLTPGISGEDGNCAVNKWMTHPAFTSFGDIKGFWVGKFETGYKDANNNTFTDQNKNNTNKKDLSKIIIKPNEYSWTNINPYNAFQNSYDYQRNLDSHMMKNTEWGAVAYLTQSIYGRCEIKDGKIVCNEVRTNNSKNGITGVAAVHAPTIPSVSSDAESSKENEFADTIPKQDNDVSYNYLNKNSVLASTTGNYSGVYDMAGGYWEYVMGVMTNEQNNSINYSSSGFNDNSFPSDSKYYDKYKYGTSNTDFSRRILGDATGELGPFKGNQSSFFEDHSAFVEYYTNKDTTNMYSWFHRGGGWSDGTFNGIYYFGRLSGIEGGDTTFRIILSPQ